jgi:hypothetical protein
LDIERRCYRCRGYTASKTTKMCHQREISPALQSAALSLYPTFCIEELRKTMESARILTRIVPPARKK